MSFFADFKRRNVFRVVTAYVIVAWLVIQVVETIFPAFGLDDSYFRLLVIALTIGLVPVVILAWAFGLTREGKRNLPAHGRADQQQRQFRQDSPSSVLRQPRFAVPALLTLLVALAAIGLLATRLAVFQQTRLEAIPEIIRLVAQDDYTSAYALAEEAQDYLADDPIFADLWSTFTVRTSIYTEPSGVEVFVREYSAPEDEWRRLGRTPIESARLPRTVMRWRFEKDGFETAERSEEPLDGTIRLNLSPGVLAPGMVRVPATSPWLLLTGFNPPRISLQEYNIDRYEVTNREFLEFVDSGGYKKRQYWSQLIFAMDGDEVSWENAMTQLRDPTGRPGPSTWEGGTYPAGEDDYPVRGVSWFEAAAYAKYRGKELPTIYEWSNAAIMPSYMEVELPPGLDIGIGAFKSELVSLSNLSGIGAAAVGSHEGVGPYGTFDMAGNVREWCWNGTEDSSSSDRYILGGAWSDPSYLFTYGVVQSPWDRSSTNGFRLLDRAAEQALVSKLKQPVELPVQEKIGEIAGEVFQVYRDLYDYDRTELNVAVESTGEDSSHWTHEIVSFDATYENERVIAHVFLPSNVEPPYQVVAYYPSSDSLFTRTSNDLEMIWIDFIIMSGRAVVYPVIMGTYERNIGLDTAWPNNTRAYSNHVVKWIQDIMRTIDYIETRQDMDLDRLGFYGNSWGGWNGPIVLALDDRFSTGVFMAGGIPPTLARPEASSASFASRVSAPVLMISGKDDVIRPVETFQIPMFNSLGTDNEYKRHAILDGGHQPPRNQLAREILDWLDQHLGPVK